MIKFGRTDDGWYVMLRVGRVRVSVGWPWARRSFVIWTQTYRYIVLGFLHVLLRDVTDEA